MSLTLSTSSSAVLLGASKFPKDDSLQRLPLALANIERMEGVLLQEEIVGLQPENIHVVTDMEDNVQVLEDISSISEKAQDTLFIYLSGHVITRKGHLYLATPHSSRKKIHINGIALDELMDVVSETAAENKIVFLDVLYSSYNGEQVDYSMVEDALKYYESAYSRTFILSSSPNADMDGFNGSQRTTVMTFSLLDILENGTDSEKENISLKDLFDSLKTKINGQPPLLSSSSLASRTHVAYNHRYISFQKHKTEADQLFDSGQFSAALIGYKTADKLLEGNKEVQKKQAFIKWITTAEREQQAGNREAARTALKEAKELYDLPAVQDRMSEVTLGIADRQFEKEQYEQARENYKAVLIHTPNNEEIKAKIEKCDHELRFLDLIDEADKLYFKDEFEKAKQKYEQALSIHPDRKASQRLTECERLIRKSSLIREKIWEEQKGKVKEVSKEEQERSQKELSQNLRQEIEKELRSSIHVELSKQLRKEIEEETKKAVKKEYAQQIWSNVSLANSIEVYDFYLQFYADSRYATKARKRLEELQEKHEEQARKVADSIKKAASQVKKPKEKDPEDKEESKAAKKSEAEPSKEEKEKADEILRILEQNRKEGAKKHRPFIKEEKSESHVNSEKPHGVLEEIEAQFGQEKAKPAEPETTDKQETEQESTTPSAQEETPESTSDSQESSEKEMPEAESPTQHEPTEEEIERSNTMSMLERRLAEIEQEHGGEAQSVTPEEAKEEEEPEKEEASTVEESAPEEVVEEEKEETPEVRDIRAEIQQVASSRDSDTPIGVPHSELDKLSEEQLWEKVVQTNTVDAYKFYVDNTKESEHLVDAYYQINRLTKLQGAEEEEPIEYGSYSFSSESEEKPSVQEPETLQSSSNGSASSVSHEQPHAEPETPAQSEAEEAEDDSLWMKASDQDTVNAYYEYVANSRGKKHLEEAKKRISELKASAQNSEQGDWSDAEAENSIDGYKRYIKKYPLGNFYAKAMFRISELEAKQ